MLKVRQGNDFRDGYNPITSMGEDKHDTMMDFGVLKLPRSRRESISENNKECAFLLIYGEITVEWQGRSETIRRGSCFDENPWVLHVPKGVSVTITGGAEDSEICITRTTNDRVFDAKLYTPYECSSEERGKGTLKEASTRIVRTVFDYANAPYSNLVIGEVINFPGKWSSYPPHHHPQPEIYFYKFYPENGYGFSQLGENVEKVVHNDTIKILDDVSHPQVAAPGYAMYYIWVIRHIEGNPYASPDYPVFEPEHLWVNDRDAGIWPDKQNGYS